MMSMLRSKVKKGKVYFFVSDQDGKNGAILAKKAEAQIAKGAAVWEGNILIWGTPTEKARRKAREWGELFERMSALEDRCRKGDREARTLRDKITRQAMLDTGCLPEELQSSYDVMLAALKGDADEIIMFGRYADGAIGFNRKPPEELRGLVEMHLDRLIALLDRPIDLAITWNIGDEVALVKIVPAVKHESDFEIFDEEGLERFELPFPRAA